MLTAPKSIAALLLAVVSWYGAHFLADAMPQGTAPAIMPAAFAFIGAIVGWRVIGTRPPDTMLMAINAGIIGGLLTLMWGALAYASHEMILRSMNRRYNGLEEAIDGLFELAFEIVGLMFRADVLGTMMLGGVVAAALTGIAARWWK